MKFLFVISIICMVITMIIACRQPGMPCSADGDCCKPLVCNPWAGRCTKAAGGPPAWVNVNKPGNPGNQ